MSLQTIGNPGGTTQQATQARTFYQRMLLDPLPDFLVLLGFALAFPIEAKAGQTVSLRRIERIAATSTPLTEGTKPTGKNLTITEITMTNQQYGDFVEYSDWFDMTAPDVNVAALLDEFGRQVALSFDTVLYTAIIAGTNVTYASTHTARNQIATASYVDSGLLDRVILAMKNRGVPFITQWVAPVLAGASGAPKSIAVAPCYIAVIPPAMTRRLRAVTLFEPVEQYAAGTALLPNEVGKYDRLRFCESTNGFTIVDAGAGGTVDVQLGIAFGAGAFGTSRISGHELEPMLHPAGTPTDSDPLGQKGSVGWKGTLAVTILNQSKLQRFEASND